MQKYYVEVRKAKRKGLMFWGQFYNVHENRVLEWKEVKKKFQLKKEMKEASGRSLRPG